MSSTSDPHTATPHEQRPRGSRNRFWWGLGIGTIVSCCLCAGIATGGVGLLAFILQDPENLEVSYELPYSAQVGDEFDFVLHVHNAGNEAIRVDNVDLDGMFTDSILDGAVVTRAQPHMERDSSVEGAQTYRFQRDIPPGETAILRFQLRAMAPGEYSGPVAVYVGFRFVQVFPVITILE